MKIIGINGWASLELAIMGFKFHNPMPMMCDWWKPIAGTLKMCLFSHCDAFTMKQCRMQNCFLPKWSATGAANCAMRRYKPHGKVDMKGVFSVSVVHWNVDSDIVTKGASVQSCKALTNSLDKALAERRTTSTDRVWLHFPSPNKQTISNMGFGLLWFINDSNRMNGNPLFLVLWMICSSRIKNLHLAGLPYWFTWRHLGTFRCSYCTAAYQRHW